MTSFFCIFEKKTIMNPSCLKCTPAKDISKCLNSLIIGTIAQTNTVVDVYFQTSTGRLTKFTKTSSPAGLVGLDFSNLEFNQVMKFNVWITLENAGIYNTEDFTIEGLVEPVKCVSFNFKTIYNENGAAVSFASQTLEYCA